MASEKKSNSERCKSPHRSQLFLISNWISAFSLIISFLAFYGSCASFQYTKKKNKPIFHVNMKIKKSLGENFVLDREYSGKDYSWINLVINHIHGNPTSNLRIKIVKFVEGGKVLESEYSGAESWSGLSAGGFLGWNDLLSDPAPSKSLFAIVIEYKDLIDEELYSDVFVYKTIPNSDIERKSGQIAVLEAIGKSGLDALRVLKNEGVITSEVFEKIKSKKKFY